MGFLDKAKEAADRAVAGAQQMAQQGQATYEGYQSGKSEGELYKALGEAYFTEHRRGGDRSAVTAALTALDEHFGSAGAAQPGVATAGPVPTPPVPTPPAPAATTPAPPPAPAGNFSLDDL